MKHMKVNSELAKKAGKNSRKSNNRKALNRKLQGKEVLSIDLGQHTSKLVLGKMTKSSVEIKCTYTFRTPSGCLENGRILDFGRLANCMKELLKEEKLKAKYALCTIENAEIITREIVLPTADETAMQDMLEFEVQQYIPVELSDYIVQSKIIETYVENDIKKTRFLSTAVPKELASSYFYLIQELGLDAAVLDIQSNSIDKLALSEMNAGDSLNFKDQSVAIVDFGYSHINVVLVEDGKYHFNRFISEGAASIDRSLMSYFDYTIEEVEKKKLISIDLTPVSSSSGDQGVDEIAAGSQGEETMHVTNMVKNVIDGWVTELERVFKFYASRSMGNTVQKILIYGGTAQMEGFDAYLSETFNIPVQRIQSLSSVRMQNDAQASIAPFVNAIGTLIRR